jgi:hypothetical protein
MNRVWDYMGFVIWFLGLGYIALWPLASPDHLVLPPALNVLGAASAIFVVVSLLLREIMRWRRTLDGAGAASALAAQNPDGPPRQNSVRPLPTVKPRRHFGLRGMPH